MANTKILFFYIFFLLIFSFILSANNLNNDNFDLKNYLVVSKLRSDLEAKQNLLADFLRVILIPFVIINYIIALFILVGFSFSILPAFVNTLIFVPLGILITFDYIIPIIRGN